MIVNCGNCGKEIDKKPWEVKKSKSGRLYCSRSCSTIVNNWGGQRNKPAPRVCRKCGAEFMRQYKHRSKILCPNCVSDTDFVSLIKAQTLTEYFVQSDHSHTLPSSKYARVRTLNRSWNRDMLKLPCAVCGYSKHVELAHIKPISKFEMDATLGEINHPDNVIQLCRNCHWEFDRGWIELPQRECSTN